MIIVETLEINAEDTAACLRSFGLEERIKEWKLLADGPDHPVPYDVIRKIIFVQLQNGEKYVMKFVREPVFPTQIIENQSAFSDLLMEHGIRTPLRKMVQGHYCISYVKEGLTMDVYLEEWVGEKIPHFTLELFRKTGAVLGKIHRISQLTGYQIGFSLLFNEITLRDTSFSRLWRNGNQKVIPEQQYAKILDMYDRRLAEIKGIWPELPKAAVQGDIYSCNNIAEKDGGLVVYDFNLAGDEVLIGDILLCWFRTVFDDKIAADLAVLSRNALWMAFIQAYQAERPFTEIEKKHLPDAYAILGAVHYAKLLNHWMETGNCEKAERDSAYLLELLETKTLPGIWQETVL